MRQSLTSVGLMSVLHCSDKIPGWKVVGLESHLPREQTIVMQTRFLFLRRSRYPSCTVNYYSLLRCGGTTSPSLNANAAFAVSCIRRSFGKGRERREEEAAYDEPSFVSRRVANGVPRGLQWNTLNTGFSTQIGTKLRDLAVGQAGASCYSLAALSSNDSKTRYALDMRLAYSSDISSVHSNAMTPLLQ